MYLLLKWKKQNNLPHISFPSRCECEELTKRYKWQKLYVNGSERVIFIPHCTKTWQIISIQNIKSRGWQKLYAKSKKIFFSKFKILLESSKSWLKIPHSMLTNDFRISMSAAARIKCDNFSIFDDIKVVMQTSDI